MTALTVFYFIAWFASAVLVLQLLLMLFGFGDDLDVEGDVDIPDGELDFDDVDISHSVGLNLLSMRAINGFFGGFGWTGVILIENEYSVFTSVLAGAVVGTSFALVVALVMRFMYSLSESGTLDYKHAIGKQGKVYLSIPAGKTRPGSVQIPLQGRLITIPAYSENDIPASSRVTVTELFDSTSVLVKPL